MWERLLLERVYRLNILHITLPPLRKRKGDVPLLIEHFLRERKRTGKDRTLKRFSAKAMDLLAAFAWPGNVRELKTVVAQASILARGRAYRSH